MQEKTFNTILGSNTQVEAYSNGVAKYTSTESSFIQNHYMGLKWQCVEYARRWLYQTKALSFDSVNYAYEIWTDINYCYHLKTKKKIPLFSHINGSNTAPLVGDFLVYDKAFLQTGHIAVIVEVNLEKRWLRVAEQNYHNQIWPANYSRQIGFAKNDHQSMAYSVEDSNLLGWKSFFKRP